MVAADVENQAGDPALDGLTGLLTTSLESSRRIKLVPRPRLFSLAREAKLGELKRIDAGTARELARLARAQVVLTGVARREGSGFVLELHGRDAGDDRPLFTVSESARDQAELPAVVDRVAGAVRRKLHERREDLRASGVDGGHGGQLEPRGGAGLLHRRELPAAARGLRLLPRHPLPALLRAGPLARSRLRAGPLPPGGPRHHQRLGRDLPRPHRGGPARRRPDVLARRGAWSDPWRPGTTGRYDEALAAARGASWPGIRTTASRSPRRPRSCRTRAIEQAPSRTRNGSWPSIPSDDSVVVAELIENLGILRRPEKIRQLVAVQRTLPPTPERLDAIVRGMVWLGEAREALALARAHQDDSPDGIIPSDAAALQEMLGEFDEVEAWYRQGRARRPDWPPRSWSLAGALAAQGRMREARRVLDAIEPTGVGIRPDVYPARARGRPGRERRCTRRLARGGSGGGARCAWPLRCQPGARCWPSSATSSTRRELARPLPAALARSRGRWRRWPSGEAAIRPGRWPSWRPSSRWIREASTSSTPATSSPR